MRFKVVFKLLGALLILNSLFMMGCGLYDLSTPDGVETNAFKALGYGALITFSLGMTFVLLSWGKLDRVSRREGIAVVGLGWVCSALVASFPFYLCEPLVGSGEERLGVAASIFEATSGITATGSTNLLNIEAWPKALLLWRATTQWLGGLGILVIFVALMSYLGMGAKSLFRNESSFQTGEVSVSRIKDTASVILRIYLVITFVCCMGLWAMGMTFFDAFAHTLTTVSTGGFSPKQDSIAYYSSWGNGWLIELWLSLFMIICSISFLVWVVLMKKRWKRLKLEEEGKYFVIGCLVVTILIFVESVMVGGDDLLLTLRRAWFNTVSMASTTGYATYDYTQWPAFAPILLMLGMMLGGCSGSTTGGFKMSRLVVTLRVMKHEVVRAFRPNKVDRIQVNGNRLSTESQVQIVTFLVLFALLFVFSVLVVTVLETYNGIDIDSAFGMVIATLCNGGPGVGSVGPMNSFAHLEPWTKIFLSFVMILGRLELYTVLVLFVPSLWKRY